MTGEQRDLSVAIVGAGPRGLFALERLTTHAARHASRLTVDLYDATPTPGAGPVYAPDQPDYLRMNFTAEHVSAWWPDDGAVPAELRLSFVDWWMQSGDASFGDAALDLGDMHPADAYVPRALVGRYLHDAFSLVTRFAPPSVRVRVVPSRVRSIVPEAGRWLVRDDGSGDERAYDELLVAGAHRDADGRSLAREPWPHAAPLVPAVFPVSRWLTSDRVPAGSTVALRGFALTAIDAALALTEGRGGRFVAATAASGLRYRPGDEAVVTVFPYSRTGRPMRPKPARVVVGPVEARSSTAIATAVSALPAAADGPAAVTELTRNVAALAATVLDVVHAEAGERDRLTRWTDALLAGRSGPTERSPVEELAHGHAVATGAAPLDAEAALGIAWRRLYPAIVERFGGASLGETGWRAFLALAAELERISFGPSPDNVAKLIALVDAGRVRLDHTAGGQLVDRGGTTELRSAAGAVVVDRVIDGVLPAPGVDRDGATPLERLLAAGRVAVAPGQRGVRVDPRDAIALDDAGRPIPGLAAIGRHTEDATIGNDTLNRTLHPQVDRWAQRVVARAGDADERSAVGHREERRPKATTGAGRTPIPTAVSEDGRR